MLLEPCWILTEIFSVFSAFVNKLTTVELSSTFSTLPTNPPPETTSILVVAPCCEPTLIVSSCFQVDGVLMITSAAISLVAFNFDFISSN